MRPQGREARVCGAGDGRITVHSIAFVSRKTPQQGLE